MSIRINNQWRICFRWMADDAEDVEIVDYHWPSKKSGKDRSWGSFAIRIPAKF